MAIHKDSLQACMELGKAVTATLNLERILVIIFERLNQMIRAKNWTLFLLDPDTQELRFELVAGLQDYSLSNIRIKVGEGIAGAVAQTGEPILVSDVRQDPRFSQKIDTLTGFTTRSLICLPLKIQKSVIGVIEVVNPEDASLFEDQAIPALSILADFVAIAIANARVHREMEALTYTDDVSGFYNTRFLHKELENLIYKERRFSLVFMDLDNFKQVVDTHGHLMASQTLGEVAAVIATRLKEKDSLVRYGGDEYVVVLPDQGKKMAREKVEQIRAAILNATFLKHAGLRVKVTASFGIAACPEDADSKKALLRLADESMYRSKAGGKNRVTVA
ncbi:MAG: sensor domain-containing diguanylate cyclase [Desulfobacterales bacterium]|nr:sensor domain-containing diguanylate cyclase [Desulfobacterales bacterium]